MLELETKKETKNMNKDKTPYYPFDGDVIDRTKEDYQFKNKREPLLGLVIGKKHSGKTTTTRTYFDKYVKGNPETKTQGRNVLIFDFHNEYDDIETISFEQLKDFSFQENKEIRRVLAFKSSYLSLDELQEKLFHVLENFQNGLLVIEGFLSIWDNDRSLIGSIITNRHSATDVIIDFDAYSSVDSKFWQNANWVRLHANTDSYKKDLHETELHNLAQIWCKTNKTNQNTNPYSSVFIDLENMQIKGVSKEEMEKIIEVYQCAEKTVLNIDYISKLLDKDKPRLRQYFDVNIY